MGNFIYFKNEEGLDVWININNISTLIMEDCGDKVAVAWTVPGGKNEGYKVYKDTADKIKRMLNSMTSS